MRTGTAILATIAASVVLAGCGGGTTQNAMGTNQAAAQSAQQAAGVGSPVRDGKLEFVVLSVDRSKTAGGEEDPSTAQGEYVNVHLSVKNTGNEAQTYFATNQKLIVNGNKFDAASILGTPGDDTNLNPGLGIQSAVVSFDVPVGVSPDAIELHDSAFSGGVKVSLAGSAAPAAPPASGG